MTNERKPIAVVVMSGGADSAVAAALVRDMGYDLAFLHFNYGQITEQKESECVTALEQHFNPVVTRRIDISAAMIKGDSALFTGTSREDGKHDKDEYVYFRNSILGAFAVAWAEALGAKAVVFGSTGEDHICPDNNPTYWAAFQKVVELGTLRTKGIKIITPLTSSNKADVVRLGIENGVPFDKTWSCHNRTDLACGECSNCRSRRTAFTANNLVDPIPYAN